jgi:hypothetical protein
MDGCMVTMMKNIFVIQKSLNTQDLLFDIKIFWFSLDKLGLNNGAIGYTFCFFASRNATFLLELLLHLEISFSQQN